jgi:hypothetical protein
MALNSIAEYVLELNEALLDAKVSTKLRKDVVGNALAHLEEARDDCVSQGISWQEAETKAIEAFGPIQPLVKQVRSNLAEALKRRADIGKVLLAGLFPVCQYSFSKMSQNPAEDWFFAALWIGAFVVLSGLSRRWRPVRLLLVIVPAVACLTLLGAQQQIAFSNLYSRRASIALDELAKRQTIFKGAPPADARLKKFNLPPSRNDLLTFIFSDSAYLGYSEYVPVTWQRAKARWKMDMPDLQSTAMRIGTPERASEVWRQAYIDGATIFLIGGLGVALLDLIIVGGLSLLRRSILNEVGVA